MTRSPAGRRAEIKRKQRNAKWHKLARLSHAYLSAVAFIILVFFAASGLSLNHPEWFDATPTRDAPESIPLPVEALAAARAAPDASAALDRLAAHHLPLIGGFKGAEIFPDEAYLHYAGSKGSSDVTIDLINGHAEYETKRTTIMEVLHNLHRGKDAGAVWRGVIDVSAGLILVMSLFGFSLFLFMRVRLATGLGLLATSAGVLGAIVIWLVP